MNIKESTPDEEKAIIEEIEVRFQRVATSPDETGYYSQSTISTGIDVEKMTEQAVKFFKKHNKSKK